MDFNFSGNSLRRFRAKAPLPYFKRIPKLRYFWFPSLLFVVSALLSILAWTDVLGPYPASKELIFGHHYYLNALTAIFYHADTAHLLSNSILLLFFGWMLNAYFGNFVAVAVSLIVGTLANFVTVSQYPLHTELIGASGMVYGMAAMWLVLYLRFEKNYAAHQRIIRVVGFVLLLLFPTQYDAKTSYLAHASGFILGAVAAFMLLPMVHLNDPTSTAPTHRLVTREPAVFVKLGYGYRPLSSVDERKLIS